MSQIPPPPPPPAPDYNQSFPPMPPPGGGYAAPVPGGYGAPQQPKAANGWAIASLITGLLGCVPLASLAAIVTGAVGIKHANKPTVNGGKGMAVAGLVLGLLGCLLWIGFAGATVWGVRFAKEQLYNPTVGSASSALTALSKGDVQGASAFFTDGTSQEELRAVSNELKASGNFKSLQLTKFDANRAAGDALRLNVEGVATFDNGDRRFRASLTGTLGSVKIEKLELE